MRNIPLQTVDATPRPVLAIGTDYPPGTLLAAHSHRRAQFLYGMSGLMDVLTDDGAWVVPPYNGVWIPPGKRHQVRMRGVSTRSLYIEPEVVGRASSARRCWSAPCFMNCCWPVSRSRRCTIPKGATAYWSA